MFNTQRAVRTTFTFPIATESPARKLVVPSVQPLKMYPVLLIPVLLAKVNAYPSGCDPSVGKVPVPPPKLYVTEYVSSIHFAVNVTASIPIVKAAPTA